MTKELHTFAEERTLCWFQFDTSYLKSLEDMFHPLQSLGHTGRSYDDVVNVYQALLPLQAPEDTLPKSLKGCRGIGKAKGHDLELV